MDVTPFNTLIKWGIGWGGQGARVLEGDVLKVAGDDHAPPKKGAQWLFHRDAHTEGAVLVCTT